MYLAIARTPNEVKMPDGKIMTTHMLFVQYRGDSQEIVPIFLSKLHAYIYLKPAGLLDEFQLVSPDSVFLAPYREAAKQTKLSNVSVAPVWCQIGLGITKQEGEFRLAMYAKKYSLHDIFFSAAKIEREIADHLGSHYQVFVENNQLSDEEIVKAAEEFMASTAKPKPSNILTKISNKLKTIFSKPTKVTEQNTELSEEDKKQIERIVEENFKENVGTVYGFMLTNKDGTLFAPKENDKHVIAVFINKLDAVIYCLMLSEKLKQEFDIIAFKSSDNSLYFKGIKNGYEAGKLRFRIIYGFLGAQTPFGTKWGKYEETSEVPFMVATDCPLSDIENGIDLRFYFGYVQGTQDREVAITGLIKTNLTSTKELRISAKKIYADMKANLVIVKDESKSFHRLIGIGI